MKQVKLTRHKLYYLNNGAILICVTLINNFRIKVFIDDFFIIKIFLQLKKEANIKLPEYSPKKALHVRFERRYALCFFHFETEG